MIQRELIFAEGDRILAFSPRRHPHEGLATVLKDHYNTDTFVTARFEDNGVSTTYVSRQNTKPVSRPADLSMRQLLNELAGIADGGSVSETGAEMIKEIVRRLS